MGAFAELLGRLRWTGRVRDAPVLIAVLTARAAGAGSADGGS